MKIRFALFAFLYRPPWSPASITNGSIKKQVNDAADPLRMSATYMRSGTGVLPRTVLGMDQQFN